MKPSPKDIIRKTTDRLLALSKDEFWDLVEKHKRSDFARMVSHENFSDSPASEEEVFGGDVHLDFFFCSETELDGVDRFDVFPITNDWWTECPTKAA
jgi:hypothetical protein